MTAGRACKDTASELWEHARSLGHDAANLDQSVQVRYTDVSDHVLDWKIADANKHLIVLLVVIRVCITNYIKGAFVQDWQHKCWLFCKPYCERRILQTELVELHLQTLLVVLAHLVDFVFVVLSQKLVKLAGNKSDDRRFSQPRGDGSLDIVVVDDVDDVVVVLVHIDCVVIHTFLAHVSHSTPSHLVHLLFIEVLIVFAIQEGTRSATGCLAYPLILVKSLVDEHPLVHAELVLVLVIEADILVIIEFVLRSVILLHVFHQVLAIDLVLRVVNVILIINVLANMLLSNEGAILIAQHVAVVVVHGSTWIVVGIVKKLIDLVIVSLRYLV